MQSKSRSGRAYDGENNNHPSDNLEQIIVTDLTTKDYELIRAYYRTISPPQKPIPPKERCRLLEPWLKLANLARPYLSTESQGDSKKFVEDFREAFSQELAAAEREALTWGTDVSLLGSPVPEIKMHLALHQLLCAMKKMPRTDPKWLADPAPAWLLHLARSTAKTFEALCTGKESFGFQQLPVSFKTDSLGRVIFELGVEQKFLNAINGSDIQRYARCEICGNFFFIRRLPEAACSDRCTGARRVRQWRRREDERVQQAGNLLRDGKNLKEIATKLQVRVKKARIYVQAAKRRVTV